MKLITFQRSSQGSNILNIYLHCLKSEDGSHLLMFEVISVLRGAVGLAAAAAGQTEARPFPSQGATWGRASRGEGSPEGPQAARAAPQAGASSRAASGARLEP